MTTPTERIPSDEDLDRTIRTWLAEGPRTMQEPVVERVVAAVRATDQLPAWRTGTAWGRFAAAARVLAATTAVVALVGVAALATGRPAPHGSGVVAPPPGSTPAATAAALASPGAAPLPTVTDASLDGSVPRTGATWKVRYPRVAGIGETAGRAVNSALLAWAESVKSTFAKGDGATVPVDGQAPAELEAWYTVAHRSASLLSLRLLAYEYPSGAAHGTTALTTFTFDLASGQSLGLADLFLPGAAFLQALSTEARSQLRTDPAITAMGDDLPWMTTGTEPTPDNFAGWAVTAGGLEVTFGQYQVAPYAAGMPAIVVPYRQLAGLLDPAGPLGSLADRPLPAVTVTLGLYSGRPDPAWTLTDVETARLLRLLTTLPTLPTAGASAPSGGLGYHGFTIVMKTAGGPDETYTAFAGTVVGGGDVVATHLDDPGRTVEAELLAGGRAHLTAQEAAAVDAALAAP